MQDTSPQAMKVAGADVLAGLIMASRRLFVLTGAGCSTESGIPDYRGPSGAWKHRRPILFQDFIRSEPVRCRYWARSMVGWTRIRRAEPNAGHRALARIERDGPLHSLVTQNVDGLHQQAGSRRVIDLHGRLDRLECLTCRRIESRERFQHELVVRNPDWNPATAAVAPDGDAHLDEADYDAFAVPECDWCGGVLKPSVVFFGENVPRPRVDLAMRRLAECDAMLVVGSSLMVWSGYRFVRTAAALGIPVAVLNLGRTRGDGDARIKVEAPCGDVLSALAMRLGEAAPSAGMGASAGYGISE